MKRRKKTEPGKKSQLQAFEVRELHRSKIANAPYNPRVISDDKRRKLEKKLTTTGLIEPLVWNEVTGNLVSGHQRLAIMDVFEGHGDWSMDVSVVHMTPSQERENNVFMNNDTAQGDWDLKALAELMQDDAVSIAEAGFELHELAMRGIDIEEFKPTNFDEAFDTQTLAMFDGEHVPEPVAAAVEEVDQARQMALEKREAAKERRREAQVQADKERDPEFYVVLVFDTRANKDAFTVAMGGKEGDRYLNGLSVADRFGVPVDVV